MLYRIKEGKHSADFTLNRLQPFTGLKQEGSFVIPRLCWYEKDDISVHGWNKLTGIAQIFGVHTNSGRLVWQPNFTKENTFRVASYRYTRGSSWQAVHFIDIVADTEYDFSVEWKNGMWWFMVDGKVSTMGGNKPICPVRCYPYFGGQSTAPWTMLIDIKYK